MVLFVLHMYVSSDIESFTSISEQLEDSVLLMMLSDFLTIMSGIIDQYGGTVDKYIGLEPKRKH